MEYDILKPVSSRSNGTKDAENSRIKEIVDEFRRRCELYEAQFRNSKKDVTAFDYEQREAERFANNKCWRYLCYRRRDKINNILYAY